MMKRPWCSLKYNVQLHWEAIVHSKSVDRCLLQHLSILQSTNQ